jgi:D-alanine-D-alanine ligase
MENSGIKGLKICILMGGLSSERQVSLRSGRAIADSLERQGFNVLRADLRPKGYRLKAEERVVLGKAKIKAVQPSRLSELLRRERIDCVFLALHGGIGENGAIQGLLEVLGIPYTGSGIMASSLAMDKLTSKRLFQSAGLRVPDFIVLDKEFKEKEIIDRFGLPLVVKPIHEGSSVGVSIVESESELLPAIAEASRYGQCLIERYISGKEVHVGILGRRAIGAVEVRPRERFYSYKAKYTPGMTEYIIPPEIPHPLLEKALESGLKAHQALGCRGASRVDLIVRETGDIYVLEVNTIPGMTETSLLPKIANSAGIGFDQLVMEILRDATEKD